MTREEGYKLVIDWTENKNLIKHMLAVEAQMRVIAKHFGENEDEWGLLGLIHDADYEKYPKEHPNKTIEELTKRGEPQWLIDGVIAHAWGYNGMETEPKNKMEWAIYTCDELSGLIIAVTLVRPEKKLESVTVENIEKKWKEKSFAVGVKREQIALCEEKLGITIHDYISMCLKALQGISKELGL